MSTTLIIIGSALLVLIAMITINYYRMKNMKPVKNSQKIKILTNKNFAMATKRGVFLVDFWAEWCGPCKIIAPVLNEIAESRNDFTIAKVNVDQYQQLAQKYKVRNIPTLLIFKDGKESGRIVGVKPKKAIIREVEAVLAQ